MKLPGLFLVLLLSLFSLTFGCMPITDRSTSKLFDHVLVVMCDDLATHALGYYGNKLVKTPHIDRLAQNSVRFMRAYANSPMCTPSRASLITGRYPHATGTTLLRTALPDSVLTIAEHLQQHGFNTAIFGKNHFNSGLSHGFEVIKTRQDHRSYLKTMPPPPLDDDIRVRPVWKPFRDHARIWLNADRASSGQPFQRSEATYLTDQAMEFISEHKNNRFFTLLSFHEPHSPFNFSLEFQDLINPESLLLPAAGPEDSTWIPAVFADLTATEKQGITASYYQSVAYIDQNVGRILAHLDSLNIRDNTLILFFSDHGYLLNHHGRFEKHMMWEEAVQVPLIMSGFGSGETQEPVELVDVSPTIMQAAGVPPIPTDGIALQSIYDGTSRHEYIFSEYLTDHKYMILQGPWKYIYSSGKRDLGSGYATGNGPSGPLHRLYNRENDLLEKNDVASTEPKVVQTLKTKLLQHLRKSHPLATSVSTELDIDEQLRLLAEPPEGENPNSF